jgi:hypothetical protein
MFSLLINNNKRIANNLKKRSGFNYYIAGEIFEPEKYENIEELYKNINNKEELEKLIGEFCILLEDEENIHIINDEIGTIKWFYYCKDDIFMVSNDFWEIVKFIEPTVNDIDKEAIYESLFLYNTFDGKTFIKDIKKVEGGNLIHYDKKKRELKISIYKDIKYQENVNLTEEKIFEEIDKRFKRMVEKIRKFNNYPKIGLTISGGLDSRFPLPFFKKEEVSSTYLIGQKNNILSPYDYDNAKKMAKIFGFKFKMINPFSIDIKEKILIDLLRNPVGASNIIKALNYDKVFNNEFDILVTGAYGGLIGGRVLNKDLLEEKNVEILVEKLFLAYSSSNNMIRSLRENKNKFLKRINKLSKYFLGKSFFEEKIDINEFLNNDLLINKKNKQNVYNKFFKFIKEQTKNKDNLNTIMKFHLSVHTIRGAFESLHGQAKSYSIYHPYIYEFSKSWPAKFLSGRYIMEKYLFEKYPELAKIPLQDYRLPIYYRFKKLNLIVKFLLKVKYLLLFFSKKLAINYTTWWNRKDLQQYIKNTFNNKYKFFYKIFNEKDVKRIISNREYTQLADDLFKLKLFIDLIESKKYKELKDNFRMSSKF